MKMADTARMPPTLTSMPPMMMISVIPALITARSTELRSTVTRLRSVRKNSDWTVNTMPMIRIAAASISSRWARRAGLASRRRPLASVVMAIPVASGEGSGRGGRASLCPAARPIRSRSRRRCRR